MTNLTSAAAIARRLSPAQKRALLWLRPGEAQVRTDPVGEKIADRTMDSLHGRSLAMWVLCRGHALSPLGLAVRQIVAAEAADVG